MPKLHRERVMSKIVPMQYEGHALHFTDDGWFNATEAAAKFSRNPNDWVRLPATQSYLAAFVRKYGNIPYLKTRRGGCGVNQWKIFCNRLRTVKVATMTPPKRKVSCMVSLSSLASTPANLASTPANFASISLRSNSLSLRKAPISWRSSAPSLSSLVSTRSSRCCKSALVATSVESCTLRTTADIALAFGSSKPAFSRSSNICSVSNAGNPINFSLPRILSRRPLTSSDEAAYIIAQVLATPLEAAKSPRQLAAFISPIGFAQWAGVRLIQDSQEEYARRLLAVVSACPPRLTSGFASLSRRSKAMSASAQGAPAPSIFQFDSQEVRIFVDDQGKPWFCARCAVASQGGDISSIEDEGRPLEAGFREQASNRLKRRLLRAKVVSVEEKALLKRQVGIRKTNDPEPLWMRRKP